MTFGPLVTMAATAILLAGIGAADAQTAAKTQQCGPSADPQKFPTPTIVSFDTGSTAIKPADAKKIEEAAKLAKANYVPVVCVTGYADKQGNPQANEKLSLRRAQAVAAQLRKHGIAADRIVARAMGEPGGGLFGSLQQGMQADRRVEIRFTR